MTPSRPDREAEFDHIVHEYYQAIENGQSVDPRQFIESHPEFQAELKSFFADVEHLGQFADRSLAGTVGLERDGTRLDALREIGPGNSIAYVGEYRILEEVARGGMGVVFKARQEKLRRTVALKMILSGRFASAVEVDRFRREARAAAALKHANIVGVHEVGVHEGNHYFTMDYIESVSLAERLREGSLAPKDAAILLETLARAIDFAHKKGVLHRDLKPGNVLIDSSGQPHITDFGLAKPLAESDERSEMEITRSGQIVGTPSYMAPEQAAAKHQLVSVASDVYSLGAILYACLSGRAPFIAESTVETLRQVIHDDPLPTRILNPRVPKDLETICLKCLRKEPRHRYLVAEELADDLKRFLEGRPVAARPIGIGNKAWRFTKRNPWASLATALIALIAVVSPTIAMLRYRQSRELASKAERIQRQKDEIGGLLVDKEMALERAIGAERDATASAEVAQAQARRSRQLLYISDMQQMAGLYRNAEVRSMRAMLARHVPGPDDPDLRDFEWYYWLNLSQPQISTWNRGAAAEYIAISPDGKRVAAGNSLLHKGTIRAISAQIWNVAERKVEQELILKGDWIGGLRFSDDGQQLGVIVGAHEKWVDWRRDEVKRTDKIAPFAAASPKNLYALSESKHLIAIGMTNAVRCFDLRTQQPLRIAVRDPDDERRRRNLGEVIHDSPSGKFVEFQKQVSGAIQTRWKNRVFQGNVTGKSSGQRWNTTDVLAPDKNSDWGPVFSLAISPSDDLLVVGTRDGHVFAWDLATGEEKLSFVAHEGIVWDVAFSPDGRFLATVSDDGAVRLWSLPNGRLQQEWLGHDTRVCHVAFGQNGYLATASDDRTIRVWRLFEEQAVRIFRGHEDRITCINFSPEGHSIWSSSQDGQVLQWSLAAKNRVTKLIDGRPHHHIELSADGRYLAASGANGVVTLWDRTSNDAPARMYGNQAALVELQFEPGARYLLGIGSDGTLYRWNIATQLIQDQRSFPIQDRQVSPNRVSDFGKIMPQVAISPDGRELAAYMEDGRLQIASLDDPEIAPIEILCDTPLKHFTFSPTGKHLLAITVAEPECRLLLFDSTTGKTTDQLTMGKVFAHNPCFSRDGRRLACLTHPRRADGDPNSSENIVVWDRQSKEIIATINESGARNLAISADGSMVAVAVADEAPGERAGKPAQKVRVLRVSDATESHVFETTATDLDFAHDGSFLSIANDQGTIQIYHLADGSKRTDLVRAAGRITSLSFSPLASELIASVNSLDPTGWFNVPRTGQVTIDLDAAEVNELSVRLRSPINATSKNVLAHLRDGQLVEHGLLWTRCNLGVEKMVRHRLTQQQRALNQDSEPVRLERPTTVPDTLATKANACFFVAPDRTLFRGDLSESGASVSTPEPLPGTSTCTAMAATTDGQWVALALGEEIQIRDGNSLDLIHSFKAHEGAIRSLCFRQDGSLLASGGTDRMIQIWDTKSGTRKASVRSHSRPITCVRFSPRGMTVVSASYDGEIHLSDVTTGEVKTILNDHQGPVHWIEFSSPGNEFASAGEDGTIRRWQAAIDDRFTKEER